jgi:hypothetical protein
MSVEETNVIDIIRIDRQTGQVVLTFKAVAQEIEALGGAIERIVSQ